MTAFSVSMLRLSGVLPAFHGDTVPAQLLSAREQARAILLRYVPGFSFDVAKAERVLHEVDTWAERQGQALIDAIDPAKNPGNTLPEQVALGLGTDKSREFMIALYTQASAGMGPWTSGEVASLATRGERITGVVVTESWAKEDADARLSAFGVIVALEQRGELAPLMSPTAAGGLGLAPAWVAVIIISAIVAAAIIVAVVVDRHLARNNLLMRDICEKAQREGRDAVVVECVNATKELQEQSLGGSIFGALAKVAAVIGVAYVAARYALPAILGRKRQ